MTAIGVSTGLSLATATRATLTLAQKANAAKIVAGRQGYAARTVMASPPTLTSSSGGAISSTNDGASATSISLLNTAKIRSTGPFTLRNTGASFLGIQGDWSHYGASAYYFGGSGWGIAFNHTGSQFEIADNIGTLWRMRMRVNGQWASAAQWTKVDFGNPADGFRVLRFNFGSSTTRLIEVFWIFDGAAPAWVNLAAGGSLALPTLSANEPLSRYWGDSFVEAGYANQTGYEITATVPMELGSQLGVAMMAPAGRSAQGFTNAVDGLTFPTRITADVGRLPARVHEIVQASINDNAATPAAVQAAVTQGLQNLRAGATDACITFILPYTFDSNPTPANIYAANRAGALAAAVADPGIVIIETSDLPSVNNGGTLPNAQTQVSFDGVHPGMAWSKYTQPIVADRILAAWQAKLAA